MVSPSFTVQPKLNVTFDSKVKIDEVEEGDPFNLDCNINANPETQKIFWMKDVSH